MYFKAAQLWRTFSIEHRSDTELNSRGRQVLKYDTQESETLRGILADASENDIKRHEQLQHVITHTVIQKGPPIANRGDMLILLQGETARKFYVHDIEVPGDIRSGIGSYTLYQVEERRDA